MTDRDRPRFAECMATLATVFAEDVSTARATAYFVALSDVEIESVVGAVEEHIRQSRFFPKPAELRARIAPQRLAPSELLEHLVGILRRSSVGLPDDLTAFDHFVIRALGGAGEFLRMEAWLMRKLVEERAGEWQEVAAIRGVDAPPRQIAAGRHLLNGARAQIGVAS